MFWLKVLLPMGPLKYSTLAYSPMGVQPPFLQEKPLNLLQLLAQNSKHTQQLLFC